MRKAQDTESKAFVMSSLSSKLATSFLNSLVWCEIAYESNQIMCFSTSSSSQAENHPTPTYNNTLLVTNAKQSEETMKLKQSDPMRMLTEML